MKIIYISIIICVLSTSLITAQDPVVFSNLANTQITQQDSIVMISTLGQPFGGIYEQNGLIINMEPFPFLLFGTGSTATRDLPAITGLNVYPNPVSDIAVLERDDTATGYQITLFDLDGKLLKEITWNAGEDKKQISLGDHASGIYLLTIMDEKLTKASHFKIAKH